MPDQRYINMLAYLPEYLREFRELKLLLQSEEPEFRLLWDRLDRWIDNQTITTADVDGIRRFEQFLKIIPLATDTLDERKRRVLGYENSNLPYTLKKLKETLVAMCGKGNVVCRLDYDNCTIELGVKLASVRSLTFIRDIAEMMIPLNLAFMIIVEYNRWKRFRTLKWKDLKTEIWESLHSDKKWQEE